MNQLSNVEVIHKMQEAGFNIVTCGDCGAINLIILNNVSDVVCEDCSYTEEYCFFPDLFVE